MKKKKIEQKRIKSYIDTPYNLVYWDWGQVINDFVSAYEIWKRNIFQDQRWRWQHMQIEPYFQSTSSILGAVDSIFHFFFFFFFARYEFVYAYFVCCLCLCEHVPYRFFFILFFSVLSYAVFLCAFYLLPWFNEVLWMDENEDEQKKNQTRTRQ